MFRSGAAIKILPLAATGQHAAGEYKECLNGPSQLQTNSPLFLFNAYNFESHAPNIILFSYTNGFVST